MRYIPQYTFPVEPPLNGQVTWNLMRAFRLASSSMLARSGKQTLFKNNEIATYHKDKAKEEIGSEFGFDKALRRFTEILDHRLETIFKDEFGNDDEAIHKAWGPVMQNMEKVPGFNREALIKTMENAKRPYLVKALSALPKPEDAA